MKVIKSGRDNPCFGKEFTCAGTGVGKTGGCGAVLLVVPRDIESATYSDYGGGSDTSYWFTCPECGAKTYVSYNAFSKR